MSILIDTPSRGLGVKSHRATLHRWADKRVVVGWRHYWLWGNGKRRSWRAKAIISMHYGVVQNSLDDLASVMTVTVSCGYVDSYLIAFICQPRSRVHCAVDRGLDVFHVWIYNKCSIWHVWCMCGFVFFHWKANAFHYSSSTCRRNCVAMRKNSLRMIDSCMCI